MSRWGILLALALLPRIAGAHGRSTSYSLIEVEGQEAAVRLSLAPLDLLVASSEGDGGEAGLRARLPALLALDSDGGPCRLAGEVNGVHGSLAVDYRWRLRCPAPPRRLTCELLRSLPAHLHLAQVRWPDGGFEEHPLAGRERTVLLDGGGRWSWLRRGLRFVRLGATHLAGGPDHLVFLALLLLGLPRLRQLALAATGFTVGHSASLALAALGQVAPRGAAVEAAIGASILWAAVENQWLAEARRRPAPPALLALGLLVVAAAGELRGQRSTALVLVGLALAAACYFALAARRSSVAGRRVLVTTLLGFIHGLGFAGVLAELRRPGHGLLGPLLGFNLGLELAQLGLLALAWPVVAGLRRRARGWRLVVEGGGAAAVAAGSYWLVGRALGG